MNPAVRAAANVGTDLAAIGRLLHAFNTEFAEPTPPAQVLAARFGRLLAADTMVLLGGDGPDGIAVLRFREAIWSEGLECYLAELYVVPHLRGRGLGRALMEEAISLARAKGADTMDLGTDEGDDAAQALYESLGFSKTGGVPRGPVSWFYELEL